MLYENATQKMVLLLNCIEVGVNKQQIDVLLCAFKLSIIMMTNNRIRLTLIQEQRCIIVVGV